MLVATSSFASDNENVSPRVKAAFENDFSKASKVKWEKSDDFYFASFLLGGKRVDAAYDEEGRLVGTSRTISSEQIPLNVSLAIAEKYAGCQVGTSVLELSYEGQTRYYVTVESDKQVMQLKCFSNGEIETDKKAKK